MRTANRFFSHKKKALPLEYLVSQVLQKRDLQRKGTDVILPQEDYITKIKKALILISIKDSKKLIRGH